MKHQIIASLCAIGFASSLTVGCGASDQKGNDGQLVGSGGQAAFVPPPTSVATGSGGGVAMPPPTQAAAGTVAPPPTTGSGGAGTMMMPPAGTGGMTAADPTKMPGKPAMDECGLSTKYAGDEFCINPPPADKGFQLHIGPSNYDNPESKYILPAGAELTSDFTGVSSNTKPVHFYYRQFRMRNGAHHNIITAGSSGAALGLGHRIGTTNHLSEDSPVGGIIAPENEGVGIPLAPNTSINVSLHSINTTDQEQLRELWINFWYRDEAEVTEEVNEIFATGSMFFAIAPGEDTILGPFTCNVTGNGRLLWMYGHRHANNVRFSTWRVRGGQKELIYEAKNWEEPLVLDYSSTVKNPAPDIAHDIDGGWSGILDLKAGDQIEWECHVINNTSGVLAFTNNTYTGEMCIVDAESVGANCL